MSPKEIKRGLKDASLEMNDLLAALTDLARERKLVKLKKNHFALPKGQDMIVGRVQGHPDGFGFLIPEEKNVEDLYLNRREMRRLMHGDRILVRIERTRAGSAARVIQILERGQSRIVGTYEELQGHPFLFAMDPRIMVIVSERQLPILSIVDNDRPAL